MGTGVANISAGEWHSAFVKTDGSLWVMGDNRYGQLGTGDFISSLVPVQIISSGVSQVSCGKFYTFIKMSDGSAKVFGSDEMDSLVWGAQNTA